MREQALRIIDANANRAREALRVIEDYTRFVLDDAAVAEALKSARHSLRAATEPLGAGALLRARDIVSDVGRDLKTATELARPDLEAVVRAAFARLSEAARAMGEYTKPLDSEAAAVAESLRYRCYELEQRVILRGPLRARMRNARLYILVTGHLCRRDWLETAHATIRGGADCIQLREKDLPDGERLERARKLRELTAGYNVLFAMNDRPDLARLARADILHVGQDDLSVRDARHIAGPATLIGKSTHTPAQFEAALAEEPDYLAVGPMFQSGTKPQDHIAGPRTIARARSHTRLPLVAIGGITPGNVGDVIRAGADCIAVCATICAADDPEAATRALRRRIDAALQSDANQPTSSRKDD